MVRTKIRNKSDKLKAELLVMLLSICVLLATLLIPISQCTPVYHYPMEVEAPVRIYPQLRTGILR